MSLLWIGDVERILTKNEIDYIIDYLFNETEDELREWNANYNNDYDVRNEQGLLRIWVLIIRRRLGSGDNFLTTKQKGKRIEVKSDILTEIYNNKIMKNIKELIQEFQLEAKKAKKE